MDDPRLQPAAYGTHAKETGLSERAHSGGVVEAVAKSTAQALVSG